jgi:hypothetical protein
MNDNSSAIVGVQLSLALRKELARLLAVHRKRSHKTHLDIVHAIPVTATATYNQTLGVREALHLTRCICRESRLWYGGSVNLV